MFEKESQEVDFLCPDCGTGFKAYIDRIMPDEKKPAAKPEAPCPHCGCRECRIKNSV